MKNITSKVLESHKQLLTNDHFQKFYFFHKMLWNNLLTIMIINYHN